MDVQKELERWKEDYRNAKTSEEKANHNKRFGDFVRSLEPADGKAFTLAFIQGAKEAKEELERIQETIRIKKSLEAINDFTSMSYIAKKYFGKTRHWLYQRINGSLINGKTTSFTPEEKQKLSNALKELSLKINDTAHSIEHSI
ncbi:DUF5053 domain-containing protein [Bacteroides sp. 519]|uniref:DUF5053 domain-containing protein n=1 Tax=Bacteroides sp. 519 TaxID=2302937 RepID=UPI0013D6A90C|nr:DUF5053 domain-containing protein [Bacteroides sp. 519]NDV59285.1 DUF5053 domain-containing protein [Bacteroides sp. 519]